MPRSQTNGWERGNIFCIEITPGPFDGSLPSP
jgi:hypothetical protein